MVVQKNKWENMFQKTLTRGVLHYNFSYKDICFFSRKKKKRKKNEENFINQPTNEPLSSSTQNKEERKLDKV